MKFPLENPRKQEHRDPEKVTVQTVALVRVGVASTPPTHTPAPRSVTRLLVVFLLVVGFLVGGGVAFRALEQAAERRQRDIITLEKALFLRRNPCVSAAELEALIKRAVDAVGVGVSPVGDTPYNSSHWDLGGAFFFAGTVITTIGYGNIAPSTEGGKIFCILYAIIGIPLFGFLLAGIGDQLGTIFTKSVLKVEKTFSHKQISQTRIRIISSLLFLLVGCVLFVTVPAVVFQHIEGWSALEAVYFVVITLTTVGIGDYVAGGDRRIDYRRWYQPLVWFWILLGLAYFAAVLRMMGDWLRVLSRKTRHEVGEWKASVRAELRETRRRLSGDRPTPPDHALNRSTSHALPEEPPEDEEKETNAGFTCPPHCPGEPKQQDGSTEAERNKRVEQKEHQP